MNAENIEPYYFDETLNVLNSLNVLNPTGLCYAQPAESNCLIQIIVHTK